MRSCYRPRRSLLTALSFHLVFLSAGIASPVIVPAVSAEPIQARAASAERIGPGTQPKFVSASEDPLSPAARRDLLSAQRGMARSQYQMALRYRDGDGAPVDEALAIAWFTRAAKRGHAGAQTELGLRYRNGRGVVRDDAAAFEWLALGANGGDRNAQFYLGLAYHQGRGVERDEVAAVGWLRQAAVRHEPRAQNQLGWHYYKGWGVEQSPQWAVYWCRLAAEQGDPDGLDSLAGFYREGVGVERDAAAALELYEQAAAQGKKYAPELLRSLRREIASGSTVIQVPPSVPFSERASVVESELALREEHLPDEVRRDRLVLSIKEHRRKSEYLEVLALLPKLERLAAVPMHGTEFFYGEGLVHTGRALEAKHHLLRYLEEEGRSGRYYREALALLNYADTKASGARNDD